MVKRRWYGPRLRRRPQSDDDGAAVVEFALLAPFLVLLVFGIVEFGFLFGQYLDVRHGARETGRLVSVNYDPNTAAGPNSQAQDIITAGCARMELADGVSVTIDLIDSSASGRTAGNFATVSVGAPATQVTGFFAPLIDSIDLTSELEVRLEQEATFAAPYTFSC